MNDADNVTQVFATLLDQRFSARVFTTEDSIRYTYFHALLSTGFCQHTDVILEYPHPSLDGEIDTLITTRNGSPPIALEFKYDRGIPSEKNLNKTNRAGAVFNDLFRLAHIPDKVAQIKYFVYVTDPEMGSYFKNESNGYRGFFELAQADHFDISTEWIESRPKSFREKLKCSPISCTVRGFFRRDLAREHYLRFYELRAQGAMVDSAG